MRAAFVASALAIATWLASGSIAFAEQVVEPPEPADDAAAATDAAEPSDANADLERARLAIREGDWELALEVLLDLRGEGVPVLYDLAVAYELAGRNAEAADALEAYLETSPVLAPRVLAELRAHVVELRGGDAPENDDPLADPAIRTVGWGLIGAGFVGLAAFGIGIAVALNLETNARGCDGTGPDSGCAPLDNGALTAAWTVAGVGLGVGVLSLTAGIVLVVLTGETERGATRALPPDLDPSMQRTFSWAPWIAPEGGGVSARLRF